MAETAENAPNSASAESAVNRDFEVLAQSFSQAQLMFSGPLSRLPGLRIFMVFQTLCGELFAALSRVHTASLPLSNPRQLVFSSPLSLRGTTRSLQQSAHSKFAALKSASTSISGPTL